jgi:hypothetical protein
VLVAYSDPQKVLRASKEPKSHAVCCAVQWLKSSYKETRENVERAPEVHKTCQQLYGKNLHNSQNSLAGIEPGGTEQLRDGAFTRKVSPRTIPLIKRESTGSRRRGPSRGGVAIHPDSV